MVNNYIHIYIYTYNIYNYICKHIYIYTDLVIQQVLPVLLATCHLGPSSVEFRGHVSKNTVFQTMSCMYLDDIKC